MKYLLISLFLVKQKNLITYMYWYSSHVYFVNITQVFIIGKRLLRVQNKEL